MGFRLRNGIGLMPLIPVYPGASTVTGFVGATDEDKLAMMSSNYAILKLGSTADIAKGSGIYGIVATVPTATTPASTATPFYIQPITPFDVIEADYSTSVAKSTTFGVVTTNIGSFFGVSNTTTIAGAVYVDASIVGTAAGTTDGLFFRMLGFSTQRGVMWGLINSSHLALS
jgi:hypothetical protein